MERKSKEEEKEKEKEKATVIYILKYCFRKNIIFVVCVFLNGITVYSCTQRSRFYLQKNEKICKKLKSLHTLLYVHINL